MTSEQIEPVNSKISTSGLSQYANGIIQTQQPQNDPASAWVLCNNNTVFINGDVQFSPPQPIPQSSKIFSLDMSSQVQCINGGQITVLGELQGYSTTAQTGQAISQATADFVTLDYLQTNYSTTAETANYIDTQINALDTVFMPIDTTLDQIPLAENTVNLNQQRLENVANPVQLQDGVNLQYIQNNYTNTTQSQSFVTGAIGDLATVYQSINTPLDEIPLAENNVDVNGFKLVNVQAGILPTDAVCLSQLDGYIPVTGNINDLTPQTADYSTQGFQISNVSAPSSASNLVNRQYVDTQIEGLSSVYQPQSGMADYVLTTFLETYYITSGDIANSYQQISEMVNFVQTSFLTSNYTNNTTLQSTYALISSLSNYVLGSTLTSTLADYTSLAYLQANYLTQSMIEASYATLNDISGFVLESFVTDNYYNKTWIDANFASVSSLSSYVLTSTLNTVLSAYVTSAQLAIDLQLYATQAYVQAYTYSRSYIDSNFALISSLSSYVTNSSLATSLSSYLQIDNIPQYTTSIQTNTSGTKSKVDASTSSQLLFNINDVQKMRIYTPAGQTPNQPTGIEVNQKLQFLTGENSVSISGSKAIQAGQLNGTGLYLKTPYSATEGLFAQVCVQPSSANCQNLTMSSGQINVAGLGMTQYSVLCNGADGVQQNLQISAGLPNQGDQTLNFYSNSYATLLGQNLKAQWTDKVGYSSNSISITEGNQFVSKTYADSLISGLSSVYLTISNASTLYYTKTAVDSLISGLSSVYLSISSFNSQIANYYTKTAVDDLISGLSSVYLSISSFNTQIANYYTKTQADELFVLKTTALNDLAVPTGDLAMQGFEIKGLQLIPSIDSSCASKSYVDSQVAGGGLTLATAKQNFIALDGTQTNLITAPIPMNSQKITGLANGTDTTDAVNVSQLTTNINSAISGVSQVQTGTIQMWPTLIAPSGYLICDGSTFSAVTYPALFTVLGSTTLPDMKNKFTRGYDSTTGRTILDTQQDAYENHSHLIAGQTYSTVAGQGSHNHTLPTRSATGNTGGTALGNGTSQGNVTISGGDHTHQVIIPDKNTNLSTTGSTETRPINICLQFIIKY